MKTCELCGGKLRTDRQEQQGFCWQCADNSIPFEVTPLGKWQAQGRNAVKRIQQIAAVKGYNDLRDVEDSLQTLLNQNRELCEDYEPSPYDGTYSED